MTTVRIRAGDIELEYDGDEKFTKSDLIELLLKISEMKPATHRPAKKKLKNTDDEHIGGELKMSTREIAQKLSASKCSELAFAAAVHLALVEKKSTFSQTDLIRDMKTATGIYKKSMRGTNLSSAITTLMNKGHLREPSTGVFAMTPDGEQEALGKLG